MVGRSAGPVGYIATVRGAESEVSGRTPTASPLSVDMRPWLVVVVGASVLLCLVELALIRTTLPDLVWLVGTLAFVGVLYVVAGVAACSRRPGNRLGPGLVIVGLVTLVARLSVVQDEFLATVGLVLAQAPLAGLVVLLLLFPSGRFTGRSDRALAVVALLVTVGLAAPTSLFRPEDPSGALRLDHRPDVVTVLNRVQVVVWWVLLLVVVAVLVRRLLTQRAVRAERRARVAVYVTGIASIVLLPLVAQVGLARGWPELVVFVVQVSLLAVVPLVFATSLLVGGFSATGRLDELATWLASSRRDGQLPGGGSDDPAPVSGADRTVLREALALTLGDESLQLLLRRGTGLVDDRGRAVAEPGTTGPTGVVEIGLDSGSSVVIVYDIAAVPEPLHVEAAARMIAMAIDRDELAGQLLTERAALRRSRARLVEVGDVERRRLARDLHDGLQARMVLTAIRVGAMAADPASSAETRRTLTGLGQELEDAVDELRRLVHGVMPALLVERGLLPAARDLVERCGVPGRVRVAGPPATTSQAVVTSAYFVIAEAVANTVKHARARELEVVVAQDDALLSVEVRDDGRGCRLDASHQGAGLRSMADRGWALGGTFSFRSDTGEGSCVRAVLPCTPGHSPS